MDHFLSGVLVYFPSGATNCPKFGGAEIALNVRDSPRPFTIRGVAMKHVFAFGMILAFWVPVLGQNGITGTWDVAERPVRIQLTTTGSTVTGTVGGQEIIEGRIDGLPSSSSGKVPTVTGPSQSPVEWRTTRSRSHARGWRFAMEATLAEVASTERPVPSNLRRSASVPHRVTPSRR